MDGMALEDYEKHCDTNRTTVKEMLELAKSYNKVNITKKTKLFFIKFFISLFIYLQALEDEDKMTPEQLAIKNVGKQDPKRHLEEKVDNLMSGNIVQCLGSMLDTVVFK